MLEFHAYESRQMRKQASTDAAWLSSARGVNLEKDFSRPSVVMRSVKIRLISVKLIDFWVTFG